MTPNENQQTLKDLESRLTEVTQKLETLQAKLDSFEKESWIHEKMEDITDKHETIKKEIKKPENHVHHKKTGISRMLDDIDNDLREAWTYMM